tara:strand:+ start:974 stop:1303 length:330 start_codon:yes stop_codon:yes gene_type:complete
MNEAIITPINTKITPWDEVKKSYEKSWLDQQNIFKEQVRHNFTNLIDNFSTGKQEIFQLCENSKKEPLFINTFLEMFDSRYAPHISEKKEKNGIMIRVLYITLPYNYQN